SVAVAADLVADAVQEQGLVLERLQRFGAFAQRELLAGFLGPEVVGEDAIGAEHDDETLLGLRLLAGANAGEVQHKRHRRGAEAEFADEVTAIAAARHGHSHIAPGLPGETSECRRQCTKSSYGLARFSPGKPGRPVSAEDAMISTASLRMLKPFAAKVSRKSSSVAGP